MECGLNISFHGLRVLRLVCMRSVVPDRNSTFERASSGEVGIVPYVVDIVAGDLDKFRREEEGKLRMY
ncbi:hypothetical protein Hanom_Chr02g00095721 [Helianthus anomalus]